MAYSRGCPDVFLGSGVTNLFFEVYRRGIILSLYLAEKPAIVASIFYVIVGISFPVKINRYIDTGNQSNKVSYNTYFLKLLSRIAADVKSCLAYFLIMSGKVPYQRTK
jgi:hypothetical protein